MLVGVGTAFGVLPSVCLSVCFFVRSTAKECSNYVRGMTLGYPRSDTVSGFKGQVDKVSKCIFHTNVRSITQNDTAAATTTTTTTTTTSTTILLLCLCDFLS